MCGIFKLDHIVGVFNFFPKVISFKSAGPLTGVKILLQYFMLSCPSYHVLHSGQPCCGCEQGEKVKQKIGCFMPSGFQDAFERCSVLECLSVVVFM